MLPHNLYVNYFCVSLERIYRDESNTTVVYFNKTVIKIKLLSSDKLKISTAVPQILTSLDDLVQINIEVFPNGEKQRSKNYVSVYATLLSNIKYCYASSLRFSILTDKKEIKQMISETHYWTEDTLPWTSSFLTSGNDSDDILNANNLNILSELFCMRASGLKSTQSVVSSTRNLVQMTYVWNVCNLLSFPNIRAIRILSTQFPSQSGLVQFVLNLAPRGHPKSLQGYSGLFNCASVVDESSLQLLINYTVTVRDLRDGAKAKYFGPISHFYSSKTSFCWGLANVFMYEQLSRQCFALEYQGVYAVDIP